MALILGGYLASTIGMVFGGSVTPKRRLASLALASLLGALLTDLFAGPVLGAVPTSKFLVLWGLFALVIAAVAHATAALQTGVRTCKKGLGTGPTSITQSRGRGGHGRPRFARRSHPLRGDRNAQAQDYR